jgi:predicted dehydrogenase
LEIIGGHFLDTFMALLGDFKSITATSAIAFPTATVAESGEQIPNTTADHFTISGELKDSGAFANIIWRAGYSSTPGRQHLLWEIDGTEGSIRITNDVPGYFHISDPKLYLNGEPIELGTAGLAYNMTGGWNEYAKGEQGTHATIEDAVRIKTLIEAIRKSSSEGVCVQV